MTANDTTTTIREVLAAHARLGTDAKVLAADADLYTAGMSSRASVEVMLALEGAFDIEFPDEYLRRDVFESIAAIQTAVEAIIAAG